MMLLQLCVRVMLVYCFGSYMIGMTVSNWIFLLGDRPCFFWIWKSRCQIVFWVFKPIVRRKMHTSTFLESPAALTVFSRLWFLVRHSVFSELAAGTHKRFKVICPFSWTSCRNEDTTERMQKSLQVRCFRNWVDIEVQLDQVTESSSLNRLSLPLWTNGAPMLHWRDIGIYIYIYLSIYLYKYIIQSCFKQNVSAVLSFRVQPNLFRRDFATNWLCAARSGSGG